VGIFVGYLFFTALDLNVVGSREWEILEMSSRDQKLLEFAMSMIKACCKIIYIFVLEDCVL
jgi:hypothetical protein